MSDPKSTDSDLTTEVDTSDKKTSRLETIIDLVKPIVIGTWSAWALGLGIQMLAPLFSPGADVTAAKAATDVLLPINSSITTLLLGILVGKKDI